SCVLIVEDTREIAEMIAGYLKERKFRTYIAENVYQARDLLSAHQVDVIVLDWMLPGPPGLDLLPELMRRSKTSPGVILLTARSEETDVVRGLDAGADDYVTKPFSLAELHARIKRLIRRNEQPPVVVPENTPDSFTLGHAHIDTRIGEVRVDGELHSLGDIGYRLLVFFLTRPNTVHSRRALLKAAWPAQIRVSDRTVDVHIYHLRKFLKDHCGVNTLRTVRQEGYKFTIN
ncbi:MAG: response regulator transcription factor, partial [Gammaproteobacteria bacterium]|nr:response regulator transcription factor [Gammaproteobacteria bacterium]